MLIETQNAPLCILLQLYIKRFSKKKNNSDSCK